MQLDDDAYSESPSQSIGEIKFVIYRSNRTIRRLAAVQHKPIVPPRLQMVHERSKKAIAHRVRYVASLAFLPFYND